MSRSRRHAPISAMSRGVMKAWKQTSNRNLRHKNKLLTEKGRAAHSPIRGEEQYEEVPQHGWDDVVWLDLYDVSEIWTSPRDGYCAYWDWWSERHKDGSPDYKWAARWAAWKERLKWHIFMK